MSRLLDLASSFSNAIVTTQQNCYWYGFAQARQNNIVPVGTGNPSPCNVPQPFPVEGTNIGWSSPPGSGYALIGTDASQQPLAFTDCTGFVAWLIAQTSPSDFAAFVQWDIANRGHFTTHNQPWPSAAAYAYAGYASLDVGNWSVVVNATQTPLEWLPGVQPGDLLAWNIQEVPGQVNDTGHVAVVNSPIQSAGPTNYNVAVIDCSLLSHGDDTRPLGTTGVGQGVIRLQYSGNQWQYNFGVAGDNFHPAPNISVLRLNV
jgi:hypothetical protein